MIYLNNNLGRRLQQSCCCSEAVVPVPVDERLEAIVSEAEIIIVAPLLPNYGFQYLGDLLSQRKPGSLAVLLPQGHMRRVGADGRVSEGNFDEAMKIISLFDLVVFSDEDCGAAVEQAQLWVRNCGAEILVTLGAAGVAYVGPEKTITYPTVAIQGEHLDSVGCGDVFATALAVHYFEERDLAAAILAGQEAAREKLLRR